MSYENGEFCQQDDDNNQQDLEEAHFHYIISAFEDLLKQHGSDFVVRHLSNSSRLQLSSY